MKNSAMDHINDYFENETSPIVMEIAAFLSDVDNFIFYASAISDLQHLPESARPTVKQILFDVMNIRNIYQQSLNATTIEDLERRADAICNEMEAIEDMMRTNETFLDGYLAYTDIYPKIKLQFELNVFFISQCGKC